MGADLYINKNDGYFRDSYGPSNLLWRMELSYWALCKELDFDDEHDLTVKGVKQLLALINDKRFMLDDITDDEEKMYFEDKHVELCKFLQDAIDLDSTVYWSV